LDPEAHNMEAVAAFLFIVVLPLAVVAGGLLGLFAIGALFMVLEHPQEAKARIEGLFRSPVRPARPLAEDHYYRPYWRGRTGSQGA
jgi:hypothetical protein